MNRNFAWVGVWALIGVLWGCGARSHFALAEEDGGDDGGPADAGPVTCEEKLQGEFMRLHWHLTALCGEIECFSHDREGTLLLSGEVFVRDQFTCSEGILSPGAVRSVLDTLQDETFVADVCGGVFVPTDDTQGWSMETSAGTVNMENIFDAPDRVKTTWLQLEDTLEAKASTPVPCPEP